MNANPLLRGALLSGLLALAGCDLLVAAMAPPPDPAMSPEAVATREAPPEKVFEGELAGERQFLLLHDCEVHRVERLKKGGVRWERVLATEFYPFAFCQREGMFFQDGALTVTLGRMAFGAGGCCATGGTWRSVDGRTWKKISENTVPRDPADAK